MKTEFIVAAFLALIVAAFVRAGVIVVAKLFTAVSDLSRDTAVLRSEFTQVTEKVEALRQAHNGVSMQTNMTTQMFHEALVAHARGLHDHDEALKRLLRMED